jgi:putative transposase
MVIGLERVQEAGELHFVTFSCFGRRGYLGDSAARGLFEDALVRTGFRYEMDVVGYVIMPEHVHLLLSEPGKGLLAVGLQALKLAVSKRSDQHPFWLARYYDFNVYSQRKVGEKLSYMHENPVKRGLVDKAEDWRWSSCRYYQTGEQGRVKISPRTVSFRPDPEHG